MRVEVKPDKREGAVMISMSRGEAWGLRELIGEISTRKAKKIVRKGGGVPERIGGNLTYDFYSALCEAIDSC
jgi:hypothetical protein